MSKKVNESAWGAIGKVALDAAKPLLRKGGKKMFRKAARTGIKKFGKNATRQMVKGAKQIAKNPEVQKAALAVGKKGFDHIKSKFTKKPQQLSDEQLVESWSKIVDNAVNEAYGLAVKAALTGGKAALKGAKLASKAAKVGKKANVAANIGSALVDDLRGVANDAVDATPVGFVKNTFKDENGNWGFNPLRGLKKQVTGGIKTLDNVFTGGLGQMAYDAVTGDDEEQNKKPSQKTKKSVQKVAPKQV